MRIVGIDPGHSRIGYALITADGSSLRCEQMGTWGLSALPLRERLARLELLLAAFLEDAKADRVGIERLYFSSNRKTAMEVSEARGVILLVTRKSGVPIVELAPNEVKRAVTGDGGASKAAVAKMVRWILHLEDGREVDDTTDALAIAIAAVGGRGVLPNLRI